VTALAKKSQLIAFSRWSGQGWCHPGQQLMGVTIFLLKNLTTFFGHRL